MSRTTIEILQDALAHFEIMQTHAEQGLEDEAEEADHRPSSVVLMVRATIAA